MSRISLALVLCGLVGFANCEEKKGLGDKKADPLVGTWLGTDPKAKGFLLILTFTADGKFSGETKLEGLNKDPKDPDIKVDGGKIEGTYKHDDKAITATVGSKEKKWAIKEMSADKIVLTNDKGDDMTFTKKK